jgi:hypothetical protein
VADNIELDAGSGGSNVATDDDGTAHHQYVKVEYGADNTQTKVTSANGLPIQNDSANALVVDLGATDNAVLDAIAADGDAIQTVLGTIDTDTGNIATSAATVAGAVSGTEMQVDIVSGTVTANLGATDNAVLDAIAADGDAVQALLGTIDADTSALAGAVSGSEIQVDVLTMPSVTVDLGANNDVTVTSGTITANLGATDNAVLDAIAADGDAVQSLLGTIDADTSALAGTVSGSELQVDIVSAPTIVVDLGANNDVTVTGTVDLGTTDNAVLDSIATATAATQAAVEGTLTVTGGGGGTQYAEDTAHTTGDTGTMALAVRLDSGAAIAGTDGDYSPLQVDSAGALRVTGGGGGTEYTVNAAAPTDPVGTTTVMERDDALSSLTEVEGDWTNMRANANGALWTAVDGTVTVDLAANNDVTVTGTVDLGATDNAVLDAIAADGDAVQALLGTIDADTSALAGTVSGSEIQADVVSSALPTGAATAANQSTIIGHVDGVETLLGTIDADTSALAGAVSGSEVQVDVVASLPAGTNNIGDVDIVSGTVTTVTTLTGGGVAHDGADSGNPHKMGAKAGTADQTAVANNDRTDIRADILGHLVTRPYALHEKLWQGVTAAKTDTSLSELVAAGGAGVRHYITSLSVMNSHATVSTVVEVRTGTTTVIHRGYALAAGGGYTITFPTPLRGGANEAINVYNITTGSNTYVSASGYTASV